MIICHHPHGLCLICADDIAAGVRLNEKLKWSKRELAYDAFILKRFGHVVTNDDLKTYMKEEASL
jgi:hypothetical protein